MKYYLFIDESGDHGLKVMNPDFPVFVLCGILISEKNLSSLITEIRSIKSHFWGDKKVIFHSRDIRNCDKEFSILFNHELKREFYEKLNFVISNNDYTVIAASIFKDKFIKKYGRLTSDVYELSLSFLIERTIFFLDDIPGLDKRLEIVIEKRGKKEDKRLEEHFQKLRDRGTGYVEASRLKKLGIIIKFESKRDNIEGLQLADLIAYPIARYVIDSERANPAFELVENKIYQKEGRRYGLKVFP